MGATFIYNFDIRAIGNYHVIMPKEKSEENTSGSSNKDPQGEQS